MMELIIQNVSDAESPLEYSPWTLISFNSKHANYDKDFDLKAAGIVVGIQQRVPGSFSGTTKN